MANADLGEMAAAIEKVKLIDRQAQEENQEHNENK